ncbi:hypothetical protein FGD71_041130, partial [Streptomyces sporangiiformans]
TDASFVLTLAGFPPGASLRSCVSDSIRPFSDPISSVLSRFSLSRFPFQRVRLYQKDLSRNSVPFGLVPGAQLRRVPVQAEP